MAAVAAEPGAAAVPTTTTAAATDDEGPPEPGTAGPGLTGPLLDIDGPSAESVAPRAEDGADGEERRHVRPELEPAAGKAPSESSVGDDLNSGSGSRVGTERFSSGGGADQAAYRSVPADPQPSAVFLHSVPDPPPVTEAGLSLAEPAEPTTNVTTDRAETVGRDRGYTALVQPELRTGPVEEDGTADRPVPEPDQAYGRDCAGSDELRESSPPGRSPKRRLLAEDRSSVAAAEPGPMQDMISLNLNPGSEVRVSLDHVIDDALVVSFRVGEKVFSGVLMDVSKRFGPYGIPITVFPRRDDRSRPQTSLQLPSDAGEAPSIKQEEVTVTPPPPHPWGSKPPPLFQEGAPYPPPLFIRDTYNQALPQPPPRKIKRPKRRYRCEEPTSIMNAIKLRPRQVLCDKCKGVVSSAGHREARRGPVDLRGEEASRRRRPPEVPLCAELKRLRTDDRPARSATDRRSASGIRVSSSSSSSASTRRVLRGVASSSSSSPSSAGRMHLKLNSKKVLSKDRSKACQVLNKLARSSAPPHRRPKDQNHSQSQDQDSTKAVTRAAALQNHNQKVHFTRRLQHRSAAMAAGGPSTALPPRMRLKPQRYRTDDTAPCPAPSSSCSAPSPPKHRPALSPDPCPATDTPPASDTPPSSVSMETDTARTAEEEGVESERGVEPPSSSSSSSSSLDSAPSECGSTETFDLPPPGSAPPPPPEEEEDEDGNDLKRRRKSSSSSSSVFSKSVSKCRCPDGRTVCVGDIVWAKIYGFPWWPARVLGITVSRRGDTGLAVRQEARVSWFGSPTTSFLPLAQLAPFLESFQSRFDRKRKGPYRRAIAEAASAAKQLTPEVRALLTQFET
ncbi:PWWP domain-containing protein 2A [Sphaeramia orbicularis]|uniref:PWWP domain-containing protein n=1 Tax=Sphaeramia orbicularis TaxID=375764 RepID=A0A673BRX1_9TELE|nr:PWWP domain-containing protein 2A [Sphaeramia orbicularis]